MLDDSLSRRIIVYAAICGSSGVVLGALGAHGLENYLAGRGYDPESIAKRLDWFDTGARYQLVHAVALLALAGLPYGSPASRAWVSRLFVLGVLLFSGSLYGLTFSDYTKLGMVAPIGGLSWIAGWLLLLLVAKRASSSTD
ncbi:MAG: DUF423 domain-containing protein [Rubripirellula sp.]